LDDLPDARVVREVAENEDVVTRLNVGDERAPDIVHVAGHKFHGHSASLLCVPKKSREDDIGFEVKLLCSKS
jgi:hypothetical protein